MKKLLFAYVFLLAVMAAAPAPAAPVPAPLFRDGAVLQRGKPVPVWGRAGRPGRAAGPRAGGRALRVAQFPVHVFV
ncbi:MAG: hypothetical protein LBC18_13870 [Opitutaceae bacterium]|jgi:sialate O-acetylesterase|nr:hypothetical protein [Opitutaceae bacterium]